MLTLLKILVINSSDVTNLAVFAKYMSLPDGTIILMKTFYLRKKSYKLSHNPKTLHVINVTNELVIEWFTQQIQQMDSIQVQTFKV